DGIRDDLVTGVQTCALPIFLRSEPFLAALQAVHRPHARRISPRPPDALSGSKRVRQVQDGAAPKPDNLQSAICNLQFAIDYGSRSEERRVGKECRVGLERT